VPSDYLTSRQVADMLGVSTQRISQLVADEALAVAWQAPGRNGPRYFAPADVERLVEQRESA